MDFLNHRKDLFSHDFQNREQTRRQSFHKSLSKQARYSHFDSIRELSQNLYQHIPTRHSNHKSKKRSQQYYANQFMTESYLTSPMQLSINSYSITPRPLGIRCMLVAGNSITIAFDMNGKQFKRFNSNLPSGNNQDLVRNEYVILDCIYSENSFYVVDIICWKQHILYEVSADCRLQMARLYLSSINCTEISDKHEAVIKPTVIYEGNLQGLEEAYTTPTDYLKDGLLFYHNEGLYIQGVSSMVLIYKDTYCSQCPIEQTPEMQAILYCTSQGTLKTLDKKTVWQLDSTTLSQWDITKAVNLRCRLSIIQDDILDLQILQKYTTKSNRAYTYSRIIFEEIYRSNPIEYTFLKDAIEHDTCEWSNMECVYYSSLDRGPAREKAKVKNAYDEVYETSKKLVWVDVEERMDCE